MDNNNLITNGLGPEIERKTFDSVDALRDYELAWMSGVEISFRSGDHPFAFTSAASNDLSINVPETGCPDCQHTIVGAIQCRRIGHYDPEPSGTRAPGAVWTRETYATTNHLA